MSLDTSTLTAYVNQNSDTLLSLAVAGSKTGKYCTWQAGVKGSDALQIFETDAVFQADTGCGFNASGTTAITQKSISVASTKVEEAICIKSLEGKWTQHLLKAGADMANGTTPAFEQVYLEQKAKKIAMQNEKALWLGDTGSGTAYLARFHGWIKLIDTAGDSINGNPTGITVATGITSSNIEGIVDGIYELIPEEILDKDDLFIAMSWANFRLWATAVKNSNLYHYALTTEEAKSGEAYVPGTPIKVMAIPGLKGSNRIIAGSWSDFYAGTDMTTDSEKMEFYWAEEARTHRFGCYWKLGAQVLFTTQIVSFKLVP